MEDIILTRDEADTLKFAFGWVIYKKLKQTKWVLENKTDIEEEKKFKMERFVKNYQSILDKIGYVDRSKKGTIFSFKKLKPYSA